MRYRISLRNVLEISQTVPHGVRGAPYSPAGTATSNVACAVRTNRAARICRSYFMHIPNAVARSRWTINTTRYLPWTMRVATGFLCYASQFRFYTFFVSVHVMYFSLTRFPMWQPFLQQHYPPSVSIPLCLTFAITRAGPRFSFRWLACLAEAGFSPAGIRDLARTH